jgi:hypothetical protein
MCAIAPHDLDIGSDQMTPPNHTARMPLANRRDMHLRSAETWDAMAEANEHTAVRAAVNAAAKAGN